MFLTPFHLHTLHSMDYQPKPDDGSPDTSGTTQAATTDAAKTSDTADTANTAPPPRGLLATIESFKKITATNDGKAIIKFQIMVVALLAAAFMLFWNLGYYSLWEDEAITAFGAKGIVRTGDTTMLVDGNLAAYGNGLDLHNLRDRVSPALPAYATALSFVCFGETAWAARLPNALAGLLACALLLRWASRGGITQLLIAAILMLGNVSLFLFFRQCRYYGFMMFFTLLVLYLYWHWDGKWKSTLRLSLALLGLMFSYYITYVGVTLALVLDYLLWKRKETPLKRNDWLLLLFPQIAGVLAAYLFWNPYSTPHGSFERNNLLGMIKLFYMQLRDMNRNEFYSAPLMLLTIALAWYKSRKDIGRAALAFLIITVVTSALCAEVARIMNVADVRYMTSVIAPCILVASCGILLLCGGRMLASVIVAILVGFCNFSNGGMFFNEGVRSTAFLYAKELVHPLNSDPYKPVAAWINSNLPPDSLVLVVPLKDSYPLMFQAGRVHYCWQLDNRSQAQFKNLPAAFFKGESLPDFLIIMGGADQEARDLIARYCHPSVRFQ